MEVCAVWLARDFLRTAGRPIDIPPCACSADCCPPITEGEAMTTIQKFRKKPVVIEAMRWDPSDCGNAGSVVGWLMAAGVDFHHPSGFGSQTTLAIRTLEGEMTAQPGDWIIRGVRGEHYPCKPDIFEATYERVTSWWAA